MLDIPIAEFENRASALQKSMRDKNIDACLFNTKTEFQYLSGFRTPFWESPSRPWFLIIPKNGDPIAVIPDIGLELMKKTWVNNIRSWSSPNPMDEGVSLLCDELSSYSRVGMLLGREGQLRMSMLDLQTIIEKAKIEITDCSNIIGELRMVKSENEVKLLDKICSMTDVAFNQLPNRIFRKQSFEEATRLFRILLLESGVDDVPYLVGGLGYGGYEDIISPPDNKRIEDGHLLMFDTGSSFKGYFSDFDRNFGFGEQPPETMKAYELLWHSIEVAISVARPGKKASDIFAAINSHLKDQHGAVGRYGHGVGLQLTETPSIAFWDNTVLCEGMVLAIEPSLSLSNNRMMVLEENIVIRDGSPQLLTKRAPKSLPLL